MSGPESDQTEEWWELLSSSLKAVLGKSNGPEYMDPKLWIGLVGVLLVWATKSQKRWRWREQNRMKEFLIMAYILAIDLLVLHTEQYTNHVILYPMAFVLVYELELHGAGLVRKWLWPPQSDSNVGPQSKWYGSPQADGEHSIPVSCLYRHEEPPSSLRIGHFPQSDSSAGPQSDCYGSPLTNLYRFEEPPSTTSKRHFPPVLELKATNVFMDVERPLLRVICVFVGQVVLMSFYMHALGKQLRSTRSNDFQYIYWFAAVLAVQFGVFYASSSTAQFGNYFEYFSSWIHVFRRNVYVEGQGAGGDVVFTIVDVSFADKVVRSIMSFVVNAVFRDFIMFTLPIFLMLAEGPMDVFKDALALNFLTTIDDVPEKLYVLVRKSAFFPTYAAKRPMEYTERHTFLESGASMKGAPEYPEVIEELRFEAGSASRTCSAPVCVVM